MKISIRDFTRNVYRVLNEWDKELPLIITRYGKPFLRISLVRRPSK